MLDVVTQIPPPLVHGGEEATSLGVVVELPERRECEDEHARFVLTLTGIAMGCAKTLCGLCDDPLACQPRCLDLTVSSHRLLMDLVFMLVDRERSVVLVAVLFVKQKILLIQFQRTQVRVVVADCKSVPTAYHQLQRSGPEGNYDEEHELRRGEWPEEAL